MCLLFETIRIENGKPVNLFWHQCRMDQTCRQLFGENATFNLGKELRIPLSAKKTVHKCRITYDRHILNVEFIPYQMPIIRSLKLVEAGQLDYSHKFLDRSAINKLFEKRGGCDDVILVKNGLISDTSFCNVVFEAGEKLVTPTEPLLKGVRRASLIAAGVISEAPVRVDALSEFKQLFLINAMIGLGDLPPISINNISVGDYQNSSNFEPGLLLANPPETRN